MSDLFFKSKINIDTNKKYLILTDLNLTEQEIPKKKLLLKSLHFTQN